MIRLRHNIRKDRTSIAKSRAFVAGRVLMRADDFHVRMVAFDWLKQQTTVLGDVLPRSLLQRGFDYQGERVPLVAPQGIFKPRILDLPLSITTVFNGPYDDSFSDDGLLLYKYRGTDPDHPDNRGLTATMARNLPLVYLHGVEEGRYLAVWPVYIVGDSASELTFRVAVDDVGVASSQLNATAAEPPEASTARRAYITSVVRRRLHQRSFREMVLKAYRWQCAFCRIRHTELLDAAHIIPDADPAGVPAVRNGMSLCKLHHAAYDSLIVGVTPDYEIQVRPDIMVETDGPMLRHGLQGLHGQVIETPSRKDERPDRDMLALRYAHFQLH
jgi:putative restriction endonuclease